MPNNIAKKHAGRHKTDLKPQLLIGEIRAKGGRVFLALMVGLLFFGGTAVLAASVSPVVETYPTSDINASYAIDNVVILSANVTDNGTANIEIRGFVYDVAPFSEPQSTENITNTEYAFFVSESGNWTGGEYSANITHLLPGTRYFYRAGVKNDSLWGYGVERCFLTVPETEVEENVTADELNRIADFLIDLLAFLVLTLIIGLAYWHRDKYLYVAAGLALMAYGATQFAGNIYIGLLLLLLGLYSFLKAWWGRRQ